MPWAWPVLCWCWLWAKSSWLAAQPRELVAGRPKLVPQAKRPHRLGRDVVDRSAHVRDRILEVRVRGRPEREDLELETGGLVRQDLVHHEGLRVARVAFEDVGYPHGRLPDREPRFDEPVGFVSKLKAVFS